MSGDAGDGPGPTARIGEDGLQPDGEAERDESDSRAERDGRAERDEPDREPVDGTNGPDPATGTTAGLEGAVPPADGAFDWRGWLLVGAVVVSLLVVPALVVLRPVRVEDFRTTYLLLPLLPAFLLGAVAVWVAVSSRRG